MTGRIVYNERAWAVDLISEINRIAETKDRIIKGAGGEWGVKKRGVVNTVFPDIILFGDYSQGLILQGWELKLPDTPVTDTNLLENAREKALRLGLSSYLVWNASHAVLYALESGEWIVEKSWRSEGIDNRTDVLNKRESWKNVLSAIIDDLNDYFEQGHFSPQKALPSQLNEVVATILGKCTGALADHLKKVSARSKRLRLHISSWWLAVKVEHGKSDDAERFKIFATEILLHWLHRFLFAHYLKESVAEALKVDAINNDCGPSDAEKIFVKISEKRDFMQIFKPRVGSENLPATVWDTLLSFNTFLKAAKLSKIDQRLYQETMAEIRQESQRKVAGQFCTPPKLAELLVKLAIDDLHGTVLDPCCGTGTIARAAYDLKIAGGVAPKEAVSTTWASDRYAMPLQFATMSLASDDAAFEILRVFEHDVAALKPGKQVSFVDPQTGSLFKDILPNFDSIILNPPFVRFEKWAQDEPSFSSVNDFVKLKAGESIDAKSDLLVPIILHLSRLLTKEGRVGVIVSNAWLGADWGRAFRTMLQKFYVIEAVLTSGYGRWFANADVVANIVILKKRPDFDKIDSNEKTVFAVTRKCLVEWTSDDTDMIAGITDPSRKDNSDIVSVNELSVDDLSYFDSIGLNWSSHFVKLDWIKTLTPSLVKVSDQFEIARGERRGWDDLFYPPDDASIESEYLKPVVHNSTNVKGLWAQPDGLAFCCSRTIDELTAKGHVNALSWIRKFESALNSNGKPLPKVLARSKLAWYEMLATSTADLAVSINPDKRLFFFRMRPKAFVNQRLIRLTAKNSKVDLGLAHALLNSLLGVFYLEALGFGRGLGVLDLNATKLSHQMRMFDPTKLSRKDGSKILKLFDKLQKRDVMPLASEMKSSDRMAFETAVFSGFGVLDCLPKIREAVLELHGIRGSVERGKKVQG